MSAPNSGRNSLHGSLPSTSSQSIGIGALELFWDPTATREEQEGAAEGFRQILDKMAGVVAELIRNS
jgi:hypothetical protein